MAKIVFFFMKKFAKQFSLYALVAVVLFSTLGAGIANAQTTCNLRVDVPADKAQKLTGDPSQPTVPRNAFLPISGSTAANNGLFCLYGLIAWITNILFVVIGIVAVLMFVYAAFLFVTAGQNPSNVGRARTAILMGVVGLLVAAVAWVIPEIVINIIAN